VLLDLRKKLKKHNPKIRSVSFNFAAAHFLLDIFAAQQTEGNRIDIAQFCPQIIQGIGDFTV